MPTRGSELDLQHQESKEETSNFLLLLLDRNKPTNAVAATTSGVVNAVSLWRTDSADKRGSG